MEVKGECKAPAPVQSQENPYELVDFNTNVRRNDDQSREATASWNKGSKQSTWSTPLVVIALLLCLIVLLLVVILCLLLVQLAARDTACTATTGATAGNNQYSNFTQWANDIVSRVNQNNPEWTNNIVSKVNSNVTGSIPDFNEWANGVVSKVNSNVTGSLPDFNEWANGVSQNTLQLIQENINFTELDKQILQTTRDSAQKLINIVNTLSNLQDTSTSTAGVADDILLIAQELFVLHNDSTALPTSCKHLLEQQPNSPSGYYILAEPTGTYSTYCNMGTLCGSRGGWTRLAYLDMTDATQNCPSGFRLYQSGGVRACGRTNSSAGCISVQFQSNGISYSQICGRVTGYQYHSPDAFATTGPVNINSYYVDGVSITHGSPRQHVWTLANGLTESSEGDPYMCPCATGNSQLIPSFVGDNYFCESGNNVSTWSEILYTSDPLWDGQGCGSLESPCCNVPGIPWFHRDYGNTTTTDYIELRVCGDEGTSNDDAPVSYYEIYVQ